MKKTADVVIIGGGCMGASAAWHLTRLGVRDAVIVEREPLLGMGSTGRNAGGVRHQFSTEANVKLSIESIGFIERFEEETGYPIDFWQDGYLFLLSSEKSLKAFQASVELQRRLGIEVDLLSADEAQRLAPGVDVSGVLGATFCSRDGIADPNGVTMGFAKAAQQSGAEIYRETEVTGIRQSSGKIVSVETSRGSIATPVVVNAAGPYAARIGQMAGADIPVHPIPRHIFITEPLASSVPSSRIMVIDFDTTFYFHREGAGILFGMGGPDDPSFDTTVNWEFLEEVTKVAVRRLPALSDAGIAHAWAGLYEMTPDAMPIIAPANAVAGFYLINGFSGHGFQHSPAAGRILAEVIVTGTATGCDLPAFSLDRFSAQTGSLETAVV